MTVIARAQVNFEYPFWLSTVNVRGTFYKAVKNSKDLRIQVDERLRELSIPVFFESIHLLYPALNQSDTV